jgi:hypothetical protein
MLLVACGLSVVGTAGVDPADDAGPQHAPDASNPHPDRRGDAAAHPPTLAAEHDAAVDASVPPTADASRAPEYSITTTDGTYAINDGSGPCSSSGPSASIVFRNDGTSSYRKEWVGADCKGKDYGVVPPRGDETLGTFANHRWRLRSTSDDRVIVDFTIKTAGTYVVTVH